MTWWSDKIGLELEQLTGYSTSGRVLTSNGGTTPPTWQASPAGVTDHGALTGLADDDHPQYLLRSDATGGYTLIDIDCTAQATNDWNAGGDGTYALGGVNWTIANTGVADTLGPVLSTGLRWNATASATVYTNASRTACNISIPVLTLTPAFVPWGRYLFEIYCSSLTLPTSTDQIMVGLFADQPGTDHVMMGGRRNSAGTQETCTTLNASTLGIGYTDDNFGVMLDVHGVICNSGTYSSGFVYTHQGGYQSNGANNTGCFDTSIARWVIAFPSSATGNADATIARIRIRRVF